MVRPAEKIVESADVMPPQGGGEEQSAEFAEAVVAAQKLKNLPPPVPRPAVVMPGHVPVPVPEPRPAVVMPGHVPVPVPKPRPASPVPLPEQGRPPLPTNPAKLRQQTNADVETFRRLVDGGSEEDLGKLADDLKDWDRGRATRMFEALSSRDLKTFNDQINHRGIIGSGELPNEKKSVLFDAFAARLDGAQLGRLSQVLPGERGAQDLGGDKLALASSIAKHATESAKLEYIKVVAPEIWQQDRVYNEQPRSVAEVLASLDGPALDRALGRLTDEQLGVVMRQASPKLFPEIGPIHHDTAQFQAIIDKATIGASAEQKARLFQAGVKAMDEMRQTWNDLFNSSRRPVHAEPWFIHEATTALTKLKGSDLEGVDRALTASKEGREAIERYEDEMLRLGRLHDIATVNQSHAAAGCSIFAGTEGEKQLLSFMEGVLHRFDNDARIGWYFGGDVSLRSYALQEMLRAATTSSGVVAGSRVPGPPWLKGLGGFVGGTAGYLAGRAIPSEVRFRYTCLGGKFNPLISGPIDGASNQFWAVFNQTGPLKKVDERTRQTVTDAFGGAAGLFKTMGVDGVSIPAGVAQAIVNGATLETNVDLNWQTPRPQGTHDDPGPTKVYLNFRLGISFDGKSPAKPGASDASPIQERHQQGWKAPKYKFNVTVRTPIEATPEDIANLTSGNFLRQEVTALKLLGENIGDLPVSTALRAAFISSGLMHYVGFTVPMPEMRHEDLLEPGMIITSRVDRGREYEDMVEGGAGKTPVQNKLGFGPATLAQVGLETAMTDTGEIKKLVTVRIAATAKSSLGFGQDGRIFEAGLTGRIGPQMQFPLAVDKQGRIDPDKFRAQLENVIGPEAQEGAVPLRLASQPSEGAATSPETLIKQGVGEIAEGLRSNTLAMSLAIYAQLMTDYGSEFSHWTPEDFRAVEALLARGHEVAQGDGARQQ